MNTQVECLLESKKASLEAYKDICYKIDMLQYKLGENIPVKQEKYDHYLVLKNKLEKKESMNYIGFFTLNFNEGTTIPEINNIMAKVTSKKWLTEWAYCFEQRGETMETVKGIHIHFLFIRNGKRPSAASAEIFNTYKHYQGRKYGAVKDNDHRFYPYDFWDDKIAYMAGDKWDPDKLQKVEVDQSWRSANNLKPLYRSLNSEEEDTSFL